MEAAKLRPNAARYWVKKVEQLNMRKCQQILNKVPDRLISDVAREFAMGMIDENAQRLLSL